MRYFLILLLLALIIPIASSATVITTIVNQMNYSPISAAIPTDGSPFFIVAPNGAGINFDSLLSAGDVINTIDIDISNSTPGMWDYVITFYDGTSQIKGMLNISEPSAPYGMTFFANNEYTLTFQGDIIRTGGWGTPRNGIYHFEYWGDNALLNGQAARGVLSTQNVYIGAQYCSQMGVLSTCGGDLVLTNYPSKTISENPMTHLSIVSNNTFGTNTGTIAVLIQVSTPAAISGNGPSSSAGYVCNFWDPFTWPGCMLNWLVNVIPGAGLIITIIQAIWGIAAWIFSNFMIFVFLVPGTDFAYRVSTEPDVFLAISKTSSDIIYLVEAIVKFFYFIVRTIIPI